MMSSGLTGDRRDVSWIVNLRVIAWYLHLSYFVSGNKGSYDAWPRPASTYDPDIYVFEARPDDKMRRGKGLREDVNKDVASTAGYCAVCGLPATALIGISQDEWQRMHKPHLSEYVASYPLIEMRMTRQDCMDLIKKSGYPLPPKSGCYFCPFQGPQQWRKLYETERDKFNYAMQLEERDPKFPTYTLARDRKGPLPLRKMLIRFGEGSKDLTEFDTDLSEEMSCEQGGYCHI